MSVHLQMRHIFWKIRAETLLEGDKLLRQLFPLSDSTTTLYEVQSVK